MAAFSSLKDWHAVSAGPFSLQGITQQLDLPHPFNEDPSSLSPQEAAMAGLEALPTSLAAALKALGDDTGTSLIHLFPDHSALQMLWRIDEASMVIDDRIHSHTFKTSQMPCLLIMPSSSSVTDPRLSKFGSAGFLCLRLKLAGIQTVFKSACAYMF